MQKYINCLRAKHYIKNILILIPAIFSKKLLDITALPDIAWGILSFCALSSVIYIFNDLCDMPHDQKHPTKQNRPIASGAISPKAAIVIMLLLLVVAGITNYLSCGTAFLPWILLLLYLAQNILYSLKLKQIPVLDVAILASGFLIRVFYGSAILGISVSKWLCLTVLAVSFYIGFSKRRNEFIRLEKKETRSVLQIYTYDFLDKNMYVSAALAIVFYSLWSVDPATIANFNSNALIWTVPIVILICITYSLSVEKSSADDPVDILFENKFLLLLVILYGLFILCLIYINEVLLW